MKFGKHIQKRQLEIPEYAASFVDYKALKKLIKKLSSTPVIPPLGDSSHGYEALDPQTSLQANKATFFFRVVCICCVFQAKFLLIVPGTRTGESQHILSPEGSGASSATDHAPGQEAGHAAASAVSLKDILAVHCARRRPKTV